MILSTFKTIRGVRNYLNGIKQLCRLTLAVLTTYFTTENQNTHISFCKNRFHKGRLLCVDPLGDYLNQMGELTIWLLVIGLSHETMYVYLFVYFCLFVCSSVCLCACPWVFVCPSVSFCLFVCLSVCLFLWRIEYCPPPWGQEYPRM